MPAASIVGVGAVLVAGRADERRNDRELPGG